MHLPELCVSVVLASHISCFILESRNFDIRSTENTLFESCDVIYGVDLTAHDCEEAINKLPEDIPSDIRRDPETGRLRYPIFSRTIANPRFKLPVNEEAGECIVDISLSPGRQFDSSLWSLIRLEAKTIVTNCVSRMDGIGGVQLTGERNGIRVTLYQDTFLKIPNNTVGIY